MMKFAKRALIAGVMVATSVPALAVNVAPVTTAAQNKQLQSDFLDYLQTSMTYFGMLNSLLDPNGSNKALSSAFEAFMQAQKTYFGYINNLITRS